MCQVHTGAYVSLLAPGKTDYTVCHPRKTTTYILHVVPITTHTDDRRKSIGEKKQKKGKIKGRKSKKAKNEKGKERKEKTRTKKKKKARKDEYTKPTPRTTHHTPHKSMEHPENRQYRKTLSIPRSSKKKMGRPRLTSSTLYELLTT